MADSGRGTAREGRPRRRPRRRPRPQVPGCRASSSWGIVGRRRRARRLGVGGHPLRHGSLARPAAPRRVSLSAGMLANKGRIMQWSSPPWREPSETHGRRPGRQAYCHHVPVHHIRKRHHEASQPLVTAVSLPAPHPPRAPRQVQGPGGGWRAARAPRTASARASRSSWTDRATAARDLELHLVEVGVCPLGGHGMGDLLEAVNHPRNRSAISSIRISMPAARQRGALGVYPTLAQGAQRSRPQCEECGIACMAGITWPCASPSPILPPGPAAVAEIRTSSPSASQLRLVPSGSASGPCFPPGKLDQRPVLIRRCPLTVPDANRSPVRSDAPLTVMCASI